MSNLTRSRYADLAPLEMERDLLPARILLPLVRADYLRRYSEVIAERIKRNPNV